MEPLIYSYTDRVCAQAVCLQGAWRSAVAGPTAKPRNAAGGRLGPNPKGRVLARAWTASFVVHVQQAHYTPHSLPVARNDSGATVSE
jgi:hypothetical protein